MTNPFDHPPASHAIVKWLFVLYVLFVVYGSLVPLQYVYRSLDDAILAFQNIPFLVLGVDSRADWVANGVLYVPVGFLTACLLMQTFQKVPRTLLLATAGAFSLALAVGVEFTQLFFPPRTVSLNDILAECIGSLVGLALSTRYANWFDTLLKSFLHDPQRLKVLTLDGYVFAYLAFAFFPYDFLVSWPELSTKIDSSNWGWLVASSAPRLMLVSLQLAVEVALTLPLGLLLARLAGFANHKQAVLIGLLLGGFIELVQFFMASGVSQGLSVLTRAVGVWGGLVLSRHRDRWTSHQIVLVLRRFTTLIVTAYLIALLEINGWFNASWQGLNAATAQLAQVNFMPFYYHYYTTEAMALFSLGVVSISYMPIALLAWAHGRSPKFALGMALVSAMGIESSKLFIRGAHPDPTNILLACAASWFTVRLLRQLSQKERKPVDIVAASVADKKGLPIWLLLCLAATGVWVATFPAFPLLVGPVLITCAATVWHRPVSVFAIIPAALPVFDLAPWSGRFFLDEFDALLLVCLAVAYGRAPALPRSRSRADILFIVATTLVVLSFVISTLQGLWPFTLPDANAFNNYYSHYNALRIVKGAFWALLVYGLSSRFVASGVDARRPFCWGMAAGLGLTVAVVVWERVAFSGLWNFSDGYRVTGPFSAAHTGGAYIDCFLAAAIPFLIVLTLEKRHWLIRLAGMAFILASTYALMVTFSRGGYLSFAVVVIIVLLATILKAKQRVHADVVIAGLVSAMLLLAVPIFKGEFAQARMASVSADLGFRQTHWDDVLNIRDPGWATSLFGMGLGRFPEAKYWRSTLHPKVGTYQLKNEAGNTYLRLGAGDSIGVDQFVSLVPGQHYVLTLDVRPGRPDAKMTVPICEKWLLNSANCIAPSFDLGKEFGAWRRVEARFTTNGLSDSPWYRHRPIKLSLSYDVPQSTIDIDNVRLESGSNTNLLRNGDFSQGLDRWFFATVGTLHAHWRVHSLYYGVLFDQGWFGVMALGIFFFLALARAAKKAWRGDAVSGAALAALSSFLVGGLFDTQIDAPRFLMLLLLLAWACFYPVARSNGRLPS
ncbi:VanZ family protein [Rhodoferax ferrireducens]|uniref:VanZ family protein n=1 Tax=Rhodoferax ferrireducens TaxID=192843 RepID=UPI000E0DB71E|nr:VanZ family protein [Rhodoferax ferrireducens]